MHRSWTFVLALLAVGFLLTAPVLTAQDAGGDANTWARYNAEKKGEAQAAVIEAFIPILGHSYAGNTSKGYLPAAVSVGGLVVMFAGSADLDAGMISLGYLGYLGGRVWGIVSAYQTAQDTNLALRQRLNLSITPRIDTNSLGFALSVPVR